MIRARLKQGIKKGLKKVLRVDISGPQPDYGVDAKYRTSTAAPPTPAASAPPVEVAEPAAAAPVVEEDVAAAPVEAPPVVEPPVVEPPEVEAAAAAEPEVEDASAAVGPADDTAGPTLTMEAVQEILDDMVRPALQGDGGDISLLKVEDDNIYVKLVGSCSTCPSSIMTMKMGVEALLKEEFPMMKELIQVD